MSKPGTSGKLRATGLRTLDQPKDGGETLVRRYWWFLPPVVVIIAGVVALCLLLGGGENGPREDRAGIRSIQGNAEGLGETKPEVAFVRRRAATPRPGVSSREHRKAVEALLAEDGAASRKELAGLHFRVGRDLQHVIRRRAAEGSPELKKELVAASKVALDGTDPGRKVAALQTLHRLASNEAADEALGLLLKNEPPEVTEAAVAYLGRVNCHEAFEEVLEHARDSRDLRVRATAIRNLILVGGRKRPGEAMPVIERALFSSEPRLQEEALRILGRFPRHVTPAVRERVKELAEKEAPDRARADVKEAARMVSEHLEMLAEKPRDE